MPLSSHVLGEVRRGSVLVSREYAGHGCHTAASKLAARSARRR